MSTKQKIIVILGPTATGKSDLAVLIAQKYNGEVISADSRQVYTGLDIGTGKITKKEMQGVPHHLLDVVSPKKIFSVTDWKKKTDKAILNILSRGKTPIICGGTGFYIQSIVDNITIPEVPPNNTLRKKLEKKTTLELFSLLQKLDPRRAQTIDKNNPVRLIRAIEIARTIGTVPTLEKTKNPYRFMQIGLTLSDTMLKERIKTRLEKRLKAGMLREATRLHKQGLSWKRMQELGLEYRYMAELLTENISKKEFTEKLETEIWHYAKRQMTWFKRDKKIKWYNPKEITKIKKEVQRFLD